MRLFLLIGLGLLCGNAFAARLGNILRPFQSDGCSNFPDGVPYFSSRLWLRCCVVHDVSYWHGGTRKERREADLALYGCVKESSGSPALANMIYLGVRLGGYPGLPTSTGWGKGWTRPRAYGALSPEEREQVRALYPRIPPAIEELPLETRPALRPGYTLSGDHCLDTAIVLTQLALRRGFELDDRSAELREGADGWTHTLLFRVKGCAEPVRFRFLLLRKSACTDEMNELLLRGRIRLRGAEIPNSCLASH